MKKLVFIFLISQLLLPLTGRAQVIEVGIFNYKSIKKVMIIAQTSGYTIYGDGLRISELYNLEGIRAELSNGKISLRSMNNDFGSYSEIELRGLTKTSTLNVKGIQPKTKEQEYTNHLKLRVYLGSIQLVNVVTIENYVGGVVEAETGRNKQ